MYPPYSPSTLRDHHSSLVIIWADDLFDHQNVITIIIIVMKIVIIKMIIIIVVIIVIIIVKQDLLLLQNTHSHFDNFSVPDLPKTSKMASLAPRGRPKARGGSCPTGVRFL